MASSVLIEKIRNHQVPKGDPLPIARVAAIQAAKGTSNIIPYCHPIPVDYVRVDFELQQDRVEIDVEVKAIYKTGVEMEALTAASVAALTIYDMLKMFDESMEIAGIRLISKKGGKTDFHPKETKQRCGAVLIISDSVSKGNSCDESGRIIVELLEGHRVKVIEIRTISDDAGDIESSLKEFADRLHADLIVTTGGTGLGPRDNTPEVMDRVIDRDIPGIAEAVRTYGQERTPRAMFSRARAGVRGKTVILNLPGSPTAVREGMEVMFPHVLHLYHILSGGGHDKSKHKASETTEVN